MSNFILSGFPLNIHETCETKEGGIFLLRIVYVYKCIEMFRFAHAAFLLQLRYNYENKTPMFCPFATYSVTQGGNVSLDLVAHDTV